MDHWQTSRDTLNEALRSYAESSDLQAHSAHLSGTEEGRQRERDRVIAQITEKLGISKKEAEDLIAPPEPIPDTRTLDDFFREDSDRVRHKIQITED